MPMGAVSPTEAQVAPLQSAIHAHPERARPEAAPRILAAGLVAHVGFVEGERTVVIPMTYHYAESDPFRLYLHGGVRGRLMTYLVAGGSVGVTVTELDGLVYSRTALNHSVNWWPPPPRSSPTLSSAGACWRR
jgi:uncharacterized protein